MEPAVGLLELSSIAHGIEVGDAMVKRAPLDVIRAGTVHPGKYLVLVGGATADVEEAMDAGRATGGTAVVDVVFLPDVHPDVVASIAGTRREDDGEALGVIETLTVATTIDAADAGVKGARVTIRELRLADDLGGKGYVVFGGDVAEVEAAVDCGVERVAASGQEVAHVVISQLHGEMRGELTIDPRFGERSRDVEKAPSNGDGLVASIVPPRGRPMPGSGGANGAVPEAAAPKPKPKPRRKRSR